MTLEDEFKIRNNALIAACRRLSSAVVFTDCKRKASVASLLANVARILTANGSWEEKADAASRIRDLLDKEEFAEQPAPEGHPWWYSDLCTLMEHATIYEESLYRVLRNTAGPAGD